MRNSSSSGPISTTRPPDRRDRTRSSSVSRSVGGPVGGDEHLLAAVDQGIEGVAELLLDRLAGQKLQVVDDEDVDRPQLLLERDRGLRLERGDEAVHEALRREVEHAPAAAFRQMRGRLDQMRLAQAHRGMNEERIVGHRLAGVGAARPAGRRRGRARWTGPRRRRRRSSGGRAANRTDRRRGRAPSRWRAGTAWRGGRPAPVPARHPARWPRSGAAAAP